MLAENLDTVKNALISFKAKNLETSFDKLLPIFDGLMQMNVHSIHVEKDFKREASVETKVDILAVLINSNCPKHFATACHFVGQDFL